MTSVKELTDLQKTNKKKQKAKRYKTLQNPLMILKKILRRSKSRNEKKKEKGKDKDISFIFSIEV